MKTNEPTDRSAQFIADETLRRLVEFFETTDRVILDTDRSFHFISEELGEAARAWNNVADRENESGVKRNHPEENQHERADVIEELGDVIMMAMITASTIDGNALGAMFAKIERKTEDWLNEQIESIRQQVVDFEAVFGNDRGAEAELFDWENHSPWFPVEEKEPHADQCCDCAWFNKCTPQPTRDAAEACEAFFRVDADRPGSTECDCFLCRLERGEETEVKVDFLSAEEIETVEDGSDDVFMRLHSTVDDLPTTNACQRRFINGVWVCQTEKTECDHRRFRWRSDVTMICIHSNKTSASPLVDEFDEMMSAPLTDDEREIVADEVDKAGIDALRTLNKPTPKPVEKCDCLLCRDLRNDDAEADVDNQISNMRG
jgi:NTP pyrophosphatase (non-canonical NTP hydrolase)